MNEAPGLIDIALIVSNPFQVRQAAAAVAELAANIEKNGLLQPPTVRKHNDIYELAFGHSRVAAFKLLATSDDSEKRMFYRQIPCFIKELDDLQMFEMAVSENIKRRDLNPVERAKAMRTYMETFKKSSAETGEFFNCDEATVRGTVRLLGLPKLAQEKLAGGEITVGAARQLLVLVRVAPDMIEDAVKQIIEGNQPADKIVEDIMDSLAFKNKIIKMFPGWRGGEASAGPGLWDLIMPTKTIAKYLTPLSVSGDANLKLAQKAIPGVGLIVHDGDLKDWINKLHGGLVSVDALIAQGADPETVDRLDRLINPPACSACSDHVKAAGSHYCTWKVCHSRKKDAWTQVQLAKEEKSLQIKALSVDEAHAGFVVLDSGWDDKQKALVEAKDPNLRLHIKPAQNSHAFTRSEVIELVTVAPEIVEAKKEEKKAETSRGSNADWQKKYDHEQKLREASRRFEETEVDLLFATLLDPIDNLGFLMAMARIDEDDFEHFQDDGSKISSRKEKLRACRISILHDMLENDIYDVEDDGPVATATYLQGVAVTWGVKLPADWLEKAMSYEPNPVPTETKDE